MRLIEHDMLEPKNLLFKLRQLRSLRYLGLLGVIAMLLVIGTVLSPYFFSGSNMQNILQGAAVTGILASGETLVILSAGIDLSVGAVLALSAVIGASYSPHDITGFLLFTALTGGLVGLFNGLLIVFGKIPPFVVTLASLSIARGLALVVSSGNPIYFDIPHYVDISNVSLLGVPIPAVMFFIVVAILIFVLKFFPFGRGIYAVGANKEVARLSGISIQRILLGVYCIGGLLSGVAAIVYTSYTSVAQPQAANGIELDAIAVVVIGGTNLFGGEGGVGRTIYGTFVIAILRNIFNLMNMQTPMQNIMMGFAILLALLLQRRRRDS